MIRGIENWASSSGRKTLWQTLTAEPYGMRNDAARALIGHADQLNRPMLVPSIGLLRWLNQYTDAEILAIPGVGKSGLRSIRAAILRARSDPWFEHAIMMGA